MKNCDYNLMHQLSRKLSFVWRVNQYIKDAKKEGHKECVKMWEMIKRDEKKHIATMKKMLGKVK